MRDLLRFNWSSRVIPGVLTVLLATACSSGSGPGGDAVDSAISQNENKIDAADVTKKQEADARFLVETTGNALLEVELGKLAQARGSSPAVREYGTRLVQNRLELLTALRSLAGAKKLTVPPALGEDGQAAYHETSTKTGAEFDKHLLAMLVKTQNQDEDAFDDMSDDAYDGDIRGFAAKYHAPVEELLDAAKEAADKLP
jgi:putative membrane protein